tara:strand:- start:8891 stop:9817 length:927 start_codon:yes stop_codon:yes gene_type:complete
MGYGVKKLQSLVESISQGNRLSLRIGGSLLTIAIVFSSGITGWSLEQLARSEVIYIQLISNLLIIIGLSSSLAAKSLRKGVEEVLSHLKENQTDRELILARRKLSYIVGRDVDDLDKDNILRATAETASENAIDGIFAPLFWMLAGCLVYNLSPSLPGPLSFAFTYKSASTIDSMIGYKHGTYRWMGTFGAKLEDILTWLPSRLVLITLPLICKNFLNAPRVIHIAWEEGSKDSSPNSGISESIFAHCSGTRMGGNNKYKGKTKSKPILASWAPKATNKKVIEIINLSLRLEIVWLITSMFFGIYIRY